MDIKEVQISIIMPVFNKKYLLEESIKSILKQSFKYYEILLIDDGSTDGSSEICEKYGRQYEFIKVFHRENHGLGPTRNYGIENATGKYMLFLDSDDWIREDALELLYNNAEINKADAVFFDFVMFDCEANRIFRSTENADYLECDVFFEAKMRRCTLPSSCTIMYKREKWNELGLVFPNVPFEDNALYPLILLGFTNKVILDAGLYYYRIHYGETITSSVNNDLRRTEPFEFLIKELRKRGYLEAYKEDIYHFCYNQLKVSLDVIMNKCDRKIYISSLRKFNRFLEDNFKGKKVFVEENIDKVDITIIVPIHNSEKYLEECLNSLKWQTFSKIEILCIDDDSKDGTQKIVKSYMQQDRRFHLINDLNGSYGHKINVGIEKAKGKYIAILESDDFYTNETLECFYNIIENTSADYVDSDFIETRSVGNKYHYEYSSKYFETSKYDCIIYGSDNHRALLSGTSAIWTGLYRKEFIVENEIKLNESPGASFQDVSFRFLVCCAARSSFHLKRGLYYYRVDNTNSSTYDDTKIMNIIGEYKYLKNELDKKGWLKGDIIGYYYFWKYTGYFWNATRLSFAANKYFVPEFLLEMDKEKNKLRICWEQLRPYICTRLIEFRQNPYSILSEEKEKEKEKKLSREWADKYSVFAQKGKTVIFGCGNYGNKLLEQLSNERENIIYFCDNDVTKWGQYIDGIEIVSPQFLRESGLNINYIIANKLHSEDIKKQLVLSGIVDDKICVYC